MRPGCGRACRAAVAGDRRRRLIGLEIAASARRLGIEVTVFERQPALCMRSVGADVSQALLELHRQQGVTVLCGCGEIRWKIATAPPGRQRSQRSAGLRSGGGGDRRRAESRTGAQRRAGDRVRHRGRRPGRTSHPAIFAAGDVARHPTLGLCLQSRAYAQNQAISTACAMLDAFAAPYDDVARFGRINTTPISRSSACRAAACTMWCAARRSRRCSSR